MKPSELVRWRKEHGYTQQSLADTLKVAKNTIYRWEKAMRDIPSFLHLALRCLELEGGETKESKGKKTKKKRG